MCKKDWNPLKDYALKMNDMCLLLSTKLDIASIISDKPHLTEVFDCSSQKLGEHQSWVWKVSSVPQQTQIAFTVISNPELLFWKTTAAVHVAWLTLGIQYHPTRLLGSFGIITFGHLPSWRVTAWVKNFETGQTRWMPHDATKLLLGRTSLPKVQEDVWSHKVKIYLLLYLKPTSNESKVTRIHASKFDALILQWSALVSSKICT